MGGVLVGTLAFSVHGNLLGVRFDRQSLRTQDVDLAQDRAIGIALSRETAPVDVGRSLTSLIPKETVREALSRLDAGVREGLERSLG